MNDILTSEEIEEIDKSESFATAVNEMVDFMNNGLEMKELKNKNTEGDISNFQFRIKFEELLKTKINSLDISEKAKIRLITLTEETSSCF